MIEFESKDKQSATRICRGGEGCTARRPQRYTIINTLTLTDQGKLIGVVRHRLHKERRDVNSD